MGIYDRPWLREEALRASSKPPLPVVKILIIVNVAVYLAQILIFRDPRFVPEQWFGLNPRAVLEKGYVWQLFTAIFLHDPEGPFHILFNMLVLWMFGPHVENRLGRGRFLRFYLFSGLAASVAYVGFYGIGVAADLSEVRSLDRIAVGASGAIMGVIAYFTLLAPNARVLFLFFLPMRMKWAMAVIIGIDLFGAISGGGNIAHVAHLGGALYGFLHWRFAHRVERFFVEREIRRKSAKPAPKPPPLEDRDVNEAEVDRLLDKVYRDGIDSLSDREKEFLKEASRRLRDRRR